MKAPIKLWMAFEVIAVDKKVAEKSLKDHILKLEKENVTILKKQFDEVQEIEKPHPQIEKGYSQIVEIELEVKEFSNAIDLVLNYGPTMVDVLGPNKVELSLGDAQDSLNTVTGMMHKFLQAGIGGVVLFNNEE